MQRRILALVVLTVVLPATPVRADKGQCRQGELCVWEHDNWKGCFGRLPREDTNWRDGIPAWETCPNVTMNDKVSSYVNNTDEWVGFWEHKDRQAGLALCVAPHAESSNISRLRNFDSRSFEDRISSHYTFGRDEPSFFFPDGGYCEDYDRG